MKSTLISYSKQRKLLNKLLQALKQTQQDPTFFSELGAAIGGGAADAVESVGGFAELTGDTLKTGINQLFGRPIDETQNPFDENYEAGDASWLDIPDSWYPRTKLAWVKLPEDSLSLVS